MITPPNPIPEPTPNIPDVIPELPPGPEYIVYDLEKCLKFIKSKRNLAIISLLSDRQSFKKDDIPYLTFNKTEREELTSLFDLFHYKDWFSFSIECRAF